MRRIDLKTSKLVPAQHYNLLTAISGGCDEKMKMVHNEMGQIWRALYRWKDEGLAVTTSREMY